MYRWMSHLCLLLLGSNILGLGFIFGLQFLIDTPAFGPPPLLPSNAFIVAIIVSAAVIVCFYQGEYRRLERESLLDRLPDRLHEDSSSLLTPLTGYLKTAPPSLSIPTVFHPSSTRVSSSSTDFDLHSQDRDRDRLGSSSSSSKQLIDSEFISASSSINLWAVSVHHIYYSCVAAVSSSTPIYVLSFTSSNSTTPKQLLRPVTTTA